MYVNLRVWVLSVWCQMLLTAALPLLLLLLLLLLFALDVAGSAGSQIETAAIFIDQMCDEALNGSCRSCT